MSDWQIFTGTGIPHDRLRQMLPEPPNWRRFDGGPVRPVPPSPDPLHQRRLGRLDALAGMIGPQADPFAVKMINAALYLRRPLLVTGRPGSGKSSLAYAVARELQLGPVLRWPITSRSTLQDALYRYDPIGRLRDENLRQAREQLAHPQDDEPPHAGIGRYLTLGPLGTALLPYELPRVLLIDEIDKSDIDLPNDLLNVFEEGEFEIPELSRLPREVAAVTVKTADEGIEAAVHRGRVLCRAFPFVVLTSNGEREFPPAFLRRCLRLDLREPSEEQLAAVVEAHLGPALAAASAPYIRGFVERRDRENSRLAIDQLLGALYLVFSAGRGDDQAVREVTEAVLRSLDEFPAE
ncbi:AAA family ATPase [Dactylosporangium sp. CA-092794]|uniref:AAA family ATPase n=1 Tax=Dactylosporangium sp. CA-092794 TaxID=3239929 RepID=UPI003D8F646A